MKKIAMTARMLDSHVSMRKQLQDITNGFFCYKQRRACSLQLMETYEDILNSHYSPYTHYIVILNLRVLLIVNEWYAQHEHPYFRNIPSVQFKQHRRLTPCVKLVHNMNPRSVFILCDQKTSPEIVANTSSTFFSYMQ